MRGAHGLRWTPLALQNLDEIQRASSLIESHVVQAPSPSRGFTTFKQLPHPPRSVKSLRGVSNLLKGISVRGTCGFGAGRLHAAVASGSELGAVGVAHTCHEPLVAASISRLSDCPLMTCGAAGLRALGARGVARAPPRDPQRRLHARGPVPPRPPASD